MLRDRLTALLEPVVAELGLQLWELEFAPQARGGLLRLYIDSDAGITVEDCERVSRAVSDVLDSDDPIPGEYTLEVSSPGWDRVLRTAAHFARFMGERARVELKTAMAGRKRFTGRLLNVDDQAVTLDVDGATVVLPLALLHKARLAPE
jgi:ribosome maturation factor RimP